jgi:hypothetical protein
LAPDRSGAATDPLHAGSGKRTSLLQEINMLRTILLVLALAVLIIIGLVWMGVFGVNDAGQLQANKIQVTGPKIETVPSNSQ